MRRAACQFDVAQEGLGDAAMVGPVRTSFRPLARRVRRSRSPTALLIASWAALSIRPLAHGSSVAWSDARSEGFIGRPCVVGGCGGEPAIGVRAGHGAPAPRCSRRLSCCGGRRARAVCGPRGSRSGLLGRLCGLTCSACGVSTEDGGQSAQAWHVLPVSGSGAGSRFACTGIAPASGLLAGGAGSGCGWDPRQLGSRLAAVGAYPVVHLSSHGHHAWPMKDGTRQTVLMMEDELGEPRPTRAADLVELLPVATRLVFVSACLTASQPGADAAGHQHSREGRTTKAPPPLQASGTGGPSVAHSLATALVSAGVPAVLGWDGSVEDRAATVFAQSLYQRLANRVDLAVAVGQARRALLAAEDPQVRADWHLARLWLGPNGGGPLVAGARKRSLVSATRATKVFLDSKQQVPVAAPEMFVGRRWEMREALRALRSGDWAGVVLHGQGRLGKSSLAARIADRYRGHAIAVVFDDYTAQGILDAISHAVRANGPARELIARRRPEIRDRAEAIETVLIDLLGGPCAQGGDGQKPLLLIIDDVERILLAHRGGPHRVAPAHAAVLAAVIRAFDPDQTDSRLVVTSRYTFTLDGAQARLQQVAVRPFTPVAQRKLQRREQALASGERQTQAAALVGRAVAVSRGNPGLQDLIVRQLVYSEQVPLPQAEAAVADMEAFLRQGDLPAEAEVRAFLEDLALDALLAQAGPANVALLRSLTLFELPVPETTVGLVAQEVGGSAIQLRGLGLAEPYPDLYDPTQVALAANPLARGRVSSLTETEQAALAALAVPGLLTAWGGDSAGYGRDGVLDLELTRLALLADDPVTVAACAFGAVVFLRNRAAAVAALGQWVIQLLDRHHRPTPTVLLRGIADAALISGDGRLGQSLLDRAIRDVTDNDTTEADPLEQARVLTAYAQRLVTTGKPDHAERLLRQAHDLFSAGGSDREAATAMTLIADIAYHRGDYAEALRVRGDVVLVYERLGDARSTAVTWGRIADIAFHRGNYEEALRICHEVELPVYERLGDATATAGAWGRIANIAYQRGDYDQALRICREVELPIHERLGDARGIAVTWGKIADIAYLRGDRAEALRVRREVELPVYERLGDARATIATWGRIAYIAFQEGDYDQAMDLQLRVLEVARRLGDLDGIAAADWALAQIDLVRKDYEPAISRLIESFRILQQLRHQDGIAKVGITLAELALAAGNTEIAREVLDDVLHAATKIDNHDLIARVTTHRNRLAQQEEKP